MGSHPEISKASRTVSIHGDLVVKIQEPGASRRERLRTLAGQKVGQQTDLFVVPEIVSFDDARGQIVFQRLPLVELREAFSNDDRSMELIGRAASVLAAIHGSMELSDRNSRNYVGPVGIRSQRVSVPLHGDFGMFNLLYLPGSDRIVVIDWANADWIGVDSDIGPPEIDIAVFLVSLFHRRLFDPWPVSHRHRVARYFLATYAAEAPHALDVSTLRASVAAITPAFARRTRRKKGSLRALCYRHSMLDLDFFLRRLSRDGLATSRERYTG